MSTDISVKDIKLKDLSLGPETINPLKKKNILTLGDVADNTREFYTKINCFSKRSQKELEELLDKYGLEFRENLELRDVETLDLSKKVYKLMKSKGVTKIGDIFKVKADTEKQTEEFYFEDLGKSNAAEVIAKLIELGFREHELKVLYTAFNDEQYMRMRIQTYKMQDKFENIDIFMPYIVKDFLEFKELRKINSWRRLYASKKSIPIVYKSKIYNETKSLTKYFDTYLSEFIKKVEYIYKNCVYNPNSSEEKIFIEKITKKFEKVFASIEKNKLLFNSIINAMVCYEKLDILDLNKVKLYMPLVIESEVCHNLIPYSNNEQYVKNDEHYKIKFKALKTELKIELEYTADKKEKSTFEQRIKRPERSASKTNYCYLDDSSSYSNSFGEKIRSEVVGTAMFLSGFLPK